MTASPKAQMETLLRTGTWQLELCEQEWAEGLAAEGVRYVLRRTPVRVHEGRAKRQAQLAVRPALVAKHHHYLTAHPRGFCRKVAFARVWQSVSR